MAETLPHYQQPLDPALYARKEWQQDITGRNADGSGRPSNLMEPLTYGNFYYPGMALGALRSVLEASGDGLLDHHDTLIAGLYTTLPNSSGNPSLCPDIANHSPLVDPLPHLLQDPIIKGFVDRNDLSASHQLLERRLTELAELFKNGVQRGVEYGYIPLYVMKHLDDAVAKTGLRVANSDLLKDLGMEAFYANEHDQIGFSGFATEDYELLSEAYIHEFLHKISGGTFHKETASQQYLRSRAGFGNELRQSGLITRTALNEALTQHITRAIIEGGYEIIDPDERIGDQGTYFWDRKVLALFIKGSNGVINLRTMTNAFFEDSGPDGGTEMRRRMLAEIRAAYGPGALNKFEKLVEHADKEGDLAEDQAVEAGVASLIHGPEIDGNGNVIRQGFIDI